MEPCEWWKENWMSRSQWGLCRPMHINETDSLYFPNVLACGMEQMCASQDRSDCYPLAQAPKG